MKEIGQVIEKKRNTVLVRFGENSHCASCKVGCAAKNNDRIIEIISDLDVRPGDRVEVEFQEKKFLFGAFLSYLFPLLFFLVGYLAGTIISELMSLKTEALSVVLSFAFLAFSYLLLRKAFASGWIKQSTFEPKIVKTMGKKEA